jgi:hypothetical protein
MRSISSPFVVAPPTGAKVRTRLRLGATDEAVLFEVGKYLGRLAGGDLGVRCRRGQAPDTRADRKRALTAVSSSRWAGSITRTANDQWTLGYKNLREERTSLQRAIRLLQQRVQAPVGGKIGRVAGYPTKPERWAKQCRLQALTARLARVDARWHPNEGWVELKLPALLAYLANRPHGRYRLTCPVAFPSRGDEVAAQAASGAVRYDITLNADARRWYLAASWTVQPIPIPSVEQAVAGGVVAVDLNVDCDDRGRGGRGAV